MQNAVGSSIDSMKQSLINNATANTIGFAGAAAGYTWKVKFVNGKYVLSDSYDQAFFVSGRSGEETTKTTTGENELEGSGNKDLNDSDTDTDNPSTVDIDNPNNDNEDPTDVAQNPSSGSNGTDSSDPSNPSNPSSPSSSTNPGQDPNNPKVVDAKSDPDRFVSITIQHPTTFKEEVVEIKENDPNPDRTLKDFELPEDTRVKISAKANMQFEEDAELVMTIVDDEGESEEIDAESMKNYRHMFRLPSKDKYFVKIYEKFKDDKKPRKQIASLCLPVEAVEFDSKMMSRE
jgi:hypothetical protein